MTRQYRNYINNLGIEAKEIDKMISKRIAQESSGIETEEIDEIIIKCISLLREIALFKLCYITSRFQVTIQKELI